MQKTIILTSITTFFLLSCGTNNTQLQNSSTENTKTSEYPTNNQSNEETNGLSKINFDKPIFAIDAQGDTVETWTYDAKGRLATNKSNYDLITENNYQYFDDGKLKTYSSSTFSGNRHDYNIEYSYTANKQNGDGGQITEGSMSYLDIETITYFIDKDCKYDTLHQYFEAEVSWEDSENDIEPNRTLTSYTTKKYQTINNEYKIIEETTYCDLDEQTGKYTTIYKSTFQYNSDGLLIFVKHENPSNSVDTETYEYNSDKLLTKKISNFNNETNITTFTYKNNSRTEEYQNQKITTYYETK